MPPRSFVYWGDHLHKKAPAEADLTIETEQVDRGMLFVASDVTLCDETSAAKKMEIGVKRGSKYFPKIMETPGTECHSISNKAGCIIVIEGEQLYGKVHTAGKDDVCTLSFGGEMFLRE